MLIIARCFVKGYLEGELRELSSAQPLLTANAR
jgi:hypothetical protein